VSSNKISATILYDDDPITIQEKDENIKNVYEMTNDSNEITVEVSDFTSQQLSDNFITDLEYVTLNGIKHQKVKQLIKKETKCDEIISKIESNFEEQIRVTDATCLKEFNKMSEELDSECDEGADRHQIQLK
jgi:hypothetical protein